MKRLLVVSGSRADFGLLEWPRKALCEDGAFSVEFLRIWHYTFPEAFSLVDQALADKDMLLVLGDRFEILAAAIAAHLKRVPIAHIGGGDMTLGSYDDAMRDCISRMASVHLATSKAAQQRLKSRGYLCAHMIGNLAADEILCGNWMRERLIAEPYVVVSYQAETIDDTVDLAAVNAAIAGREAVWITPNHDRGSERIPKGESFNRPNFLNLLYHCEEFIGNSSAMLYEAPALGVKCHMIGKRQQGRVYPPPGDGHASERIVKVLKDYLQCL